MTDPVRPDPLAPAEPPPPPLDQQARVAAAAAPGAAGVPPADPAAADAAGSSGQPPTELASGDGDARRCPRCGAALAADAPAGQCPACLMQAGLATATTPPAARARFTPPAPAELAPHFPQLEIIELIGQGGMGAVYKARQRHLDRLVALKVLPPDLGRDSAFAERFAREARALARLSHPHLVTVHDFGQTGEWCWIVMEHVDGANLRQVLATGRLSPQQALAIVPQLCEALQYAHDEGVVHRDIKPENLLLDRAGRVKIADFGLAKLAEPAGGAATLTGTHEVMGTVHYMAPEQVERSRDVDHRADIYSLGVVLYEMLTGGLPLGRFAPPSHKVSVDVRLDEVVLKALEKDPERRYQQAGEVKTDVERLGPAAPAGPAGPPPTAAADDPGFGPNPPRDGILMLLAGVFLAVVVLGEGLELLLTLNFKGSAFHFEIPGMYTGWLRYGVTYSLLTLVSSAVIAWGGWHLLHRRDQRWVTAGSYALLVAIPFAFMWNWLFGAAVTWLAIHLLRRGRAWKRLRAKMPLPAAQAPAAAASIPAGPTAAAIPPIPPMPPASRRQLRPPSALHGCVTGFFKLLIVLVVIAGVIGLVGVLMTPQVMVSPQGQAALRELGLADVVDAPAAARFINQEPPAVIQAMRHAAVALDARTASWGDSSTRSRKEKLLSAIAALTTQSEGPAAKDATALPTSATSRATLRQIDDAVIHLVEDWRNYQGYAHLVPHFNIIRAGVAELAKAPERIGAMPKERFDDLLGALGRARADVLPRRERGEGRDLVLLREAATRFAFTSAQAGHLLAAIPDQPGRDLAAGLLRARLTDPEHFFGAAAVPASPPAESPEGAVPALRPPVGEAAESGR